MAELVDALVSGTSDESRGGSSPLQGTTLRPSGLRVAQPPGDCLGEACPAQLAERSRTGRQRCGMFTYCEAYLNLNETTLASQKICSSAYKDHNAGKSAHTSKYVPWKLNWYCGFPDKQIALDFEKYLKSHSGRAFAKKRLVPPKIRPGI